MQGLKHYILEVLFFTIKVFNVITIPRSKPRKTGNRTGLLPKNLKKIEKTIIKDGRRYFLWKHM